VESADRRVRPVLFLSGLDPLESAGGHGTYVRAHALAALRAGYEPHIFSVSARGGRLPTDFAVLHRIATPFRPVRQLMIVGHAHVLRRGAERFVRGEGWRQVLIHGFGSFAAIGVDLVRRLRQRGVEAVAIASSYGFYETEVRAMVAGLRPAHGLWQWLRHHVEHAWVRATVAPFERRAYRESRLVLVNYESVRASLEGALGKMPEIRLVPYSSEAAFRHSDCRGRVAGPGCGTVPGRAAERPLVLAVSRHDARKGVDVLLQALARLRDTGPRARARLIGRGPLLDAHRRLAARLGLDEVEIPGFVADPHAHLHEADLFVLPSLQEGSGSVSLIEALQAGLPIIASACDGIPEDVTDGLNAVLVPPGDAAALAAAMRHVLADEPLRRRLSAGSRACFERRFAPDRLVDTLGDTYRELGFPP
jgi:glycosyltransferase involved in cell wall biosynthesis